MELQGGPLVVHNGENCHSFVQEVLVHGLELQPAFLSQLVVGEGAQEVDGHGSHRERVQIAKMTRLFVYNDAVEATDVELNIIKAVNDVFIPTIYA